jgi:hypothetical protein
MPNEIVEVKLEARQVQVNLEAARGRAALGPRLLVAETRLFTVDLKD